MRDNKLTSVRCFELTGELLLQELKGDLDGTVLRLNFPAVHQEGDVVKEGLLFGQCLVALCQGLDIGIIAVTCRVGVDGCDHKRRLVGQSVRILKLCAQDQGRIRVLIGSVGAVGGAVLHDDGRVLFDADQFAAVGIEPGIIVFVLNCFFI